jgi:hypothetical protein
MGWILGESWFLGNLIVSTYLHALAHLFVCT